MQIGKGQVPLRLNFDPLSGGARPKSAKSALSRSLLDGASKAAFQQQAQKFSHAARIGIELGSRSGLHKELSDRLGTLQASLGLPSLLTTSTRTTAGESGTTGTGSVASITSGSALNLGTGAAAPPPTPGFDIDRTKALRDQPFATAITGGTERVRLQVNGATAATFTVAIDINESLDQTLAKFNNLSVGGVKPITASFNDATNQIEFRVNSSGGTRVDFQDTGGTSNFLKLATENGRTSSIESIGRANVGTGTKTAYNDLRLTYKGSVINVTGLSVSSNTLTAAQRATELAAQINTKLGAGSAIQATSTGGKLGFTATDGSAPAAFDLDLTVTERRRGSNLTLGLRTGIDTVERLTGTPVLQPDPVAPPPPPGTTLGPEATLKDLATQLGLSAIGGQFAGTINGTRLTFDENQSLNSALEAIGRSDAGVQASYDATGKRVVLTERAPAAGGIDVQDVSGNLFSQLGLTAGKARTAEGSTQATPSVTETTSGLSGPGVESLRGLAERLNETLSLLEAATGQGEAFQSDPLLRDLQGAFAGLFNAGNGTKFQGLGDLGFSRANGQLHFDERKLSDLSLERLNEADAFLGTFIGERIAPLLSAGVHAIADEQTLAPLDQRLAQKAVQVQADISRLESRQQTLLFQQATFETQQNRLKEQGSLLKQQQKKLGPPEPEEFPPDLLDPSKRRESLSAPAPVAPTAPVHGVAVQPVAPGLASFGLTTT